MAAHLDLAMPGAMTSGTTFPRSSSPGVFAATVETAAHSLAMPRASIAVVEDAGLSVLSWHGLAATDDEARLELSLCERLVAGRVPLVLAETPSADGLHAFAGVPIFAADGACIGALCAMDREPRHVTAGQIETLTSLSRLVACQLEVHAALSEASSLRRELSTLVEACPVAIAIIDLEGSIQAWSPAAERLSGYGAENVIGKFPPWVPGGKSNRDFRDLLSAIRRGSSHLNQRSRRVRADGTSVEVRVWAVPLFGDDGRVTGGVAMAESVEELARAERRLHLFEAAVSKASDAIVVTSMLPLDDPRILWVNEAFSRLFGYEADEIVGQSASMLRAPEVDAQLVRDMTRARRSRRPLRATMSNRRKNGETFWCEVSLSPVVEADGRCDSWVVILRDVTEQRRADELHSDREKILEMIAADAPVEQIFAALVDAAERALPETGALVRVREGDVLYRAALGNGLEDELESFGATIAVGDTSDPCGRAVVESQQVVVDVARTASDADRAFMRARGMASGWWSPISGRSGEIFGTFAMYARRGKTPGPPELRLGAEFARLAGLAIERHADRRQLEYLGLHDALTGLPNRKLFKRRLEDAIESARERGRNVALGMIDLNRFKVINDSLGHAVGDQLLCDVADRLERCVRPGDTIARLGGDEFVLLIDDLASREDALEIAERVLLALVPSFTCAGQEVFVRASMGLSTYPADASDANGLLALGDAAMYEAKAQGREVALHERRDDRQGIARIALEAALNHALEKREFEVLFQPQVELRTREIRGAEALLRWNHPSDGLILPDAFVRVAEDTGLIVPIGAWVLEEACRFARQWQDEGFDRYVSVNVSARQFDRAEFVETVTGALEATGLEPHRLHLELTESLVMRSPERAAATLRELKALGVKIVIDDFGTGYSSFNYLKRFPLDALKIDRLFVRDIGFGSRAPNDEAIVRAIVGVARALDLKIVAEGVENEDQVAFLRAIGVPLAQGFLFAPGLRPASALRWNQAGSRR